MKLKNILFTTRPPLCSLFTKSKQKRSRVDLLCGRLVLVVRPLESADRRPCRAGPRPGGFPKPSPFAPRNRDSSPSSRNLRGVQTWAPQRHPAYLVSSCLDPHFDFPLASRAGLASPKPRPAVNRALDRFTIHWAGTRLVYFGHCPSSA